MPLCVGNSEVTVECPSRRQMTRSFDVFFDLRQNKRLSKQSKPRCFETQSRSLWCHCNTMMIYMYNLVSSFHDIMLLIEKKNTSYTRIKSFGFVNLEFRKMLCYFYMFSLSLEYQSHFSNTRNHIFGYCKGGWNTQMIWCQSRLCRQKWTH